MKSSSFWINWIFAIIIQLTINDLPSVYSKLELNVQVLICTDYSIYKLHESIVSSSSTSNNVNKLRIIGRAEKTSKQITENPVITHIKAYYTEIMDQVNERYRDSFKTDPYLNINIELVGFYIAMNPKDSQWSEMNKYEPISMKLSDPSKAGKYFKLNGDLALKDFNQWIESKRDELVPFDHAFGLTTFDIVSNQDDVDYNGLAYIYGICKKAFSGSVIEDKGAFESIRSFAHELGHNLGAEHDGLSNSGCSEWENYIMASKFFPYNQLNSWRFSNCSIAKIKEYLLDFDNNFCLLNRRADDLDGDYEYEELNRVFPGQVYDLYEQCKRLNGPMSSPCFEYQLSFCENLYCRKNESVSAECVWVAPAAEGSECGLNRWCQKGKCVLKKNFPSQISEEIPYGQDDDADDIVEGCPDCVNSSEENLLIKTNVKTSAHYTLCEDIMDGEFCQMALQNDYCGEMFYWNGRNIGYHWCRKYCNNCL